MTTHARRHPNVINLNEAPEAPGLSQGAFRSNIRFLGRQAGGEKLGCSFYEVPVGCAAFPFHWHAANEEALIILSGEGTLRLGEESIQVHAGDYVALLTGTKRAHQLRNTGKDPLRYYCISTLISPEVAGYPDSDKVGALVKEDGAYVLMNAYYREENREYFAREPLATEGEEKS